MKRDESIDRLLRQSVTGWSNASPAGQCVDAETVAAWRDGGLRPEERAAIEAHAADCDRCLSVLAILAKTSGPDVKPARVWRSARWLVPVTTSAVVVGVWALTQNPPQAPTAPPPASPSVREASPTDPSTLPKPDLSTRQQAAGSRETGQSPAAPRRNESSRHAAPPLMKDPGTAASRPQVQEERRATVAETPAATPAVPRSEAPMAAPPPAAAPAPPPVADSAQPVLPRQVPSKPAEGTRAEVLGDGFRSVAREVMPRPLVIASPDPMVRWRVSGTSVERSIDGGSSWGSQFTAAGVLAGSSPTPQVCWLVGRNGLVAVTSDGATWRRASGPDSTADLIRITANDARNATVTSASGRRYQTTDGGRTWYTQENPPTPF